MPGSPKLSGPWPRGGGSASEQGKWRRTLGVLFGLSAVGIEMGAAVGIGIGLGYYLDRKLGTAPWLLLLLSVCGLAAASRALLRLIRRLKKPLDDGGKGGRG